MSLFKSTFWYSIGNLFSRFIGFILLPFYSHLIPVNDFANYALIMSSYAIMSAVYQGGLFAGFSKYYIENDDINAGKRLFTSVFNTIFIISLIISITITIFSKNVSSVILNSDKYSSLIVIAVWMLFFDTLFFTVLHLLKTQEISRKVVISTSFAAIMNFLLNLYFVFYLQINIKGILLAQLISGVLGFAIVLPVLSKNYLPGFDKDVLKKILWFSFPLLIAGIFSTLVDVIDRFILDHMLDKTAVGIYSFSYRIAMIMNVFVISFRTAWTPVSIRLYNSKVSFSKYFGTSFSRLVSFSILIILVVSLLIDDLFSFQIMGFEFFNPKYQPGIIIIPFVLLGYAFSGIVSFYSVYPYVTGKSRHFLISDVLTFVINVILNYLLIPVWGITGAAIATTLSFAVSVIYLRFISKEIKIIYQKKELAVIVLSGIVFFAIGYTQKILWLDILLILSYIFLVKIILNIKIGWKEKIA